MDIDIFEDDKLQFVSSRFDEKGELITVKLLCKIYKAGYFIKWDEDTALLFSKGAGRNITPSLANDVVNELVKRDFFHKGIFERFSVLTSPGIQRRYKKICVDAKRKDWQIDKKYDVIEFTPEETQLAQEEMPQRKEKGKEKESKGESGASAPTIPASFKKFSEEDFKNDIRTANADLKLPDKMLHDFNRYWSEPAASGMMRFQTEKTWETKRRLETWRDNQAKFDRNGNNHQRAAQQPVSTGRTIIRDAL